MPQMSTRPSKKIQPIEGSVMANVMVFRTGKTARSLSHQGQREKLKQLLLQNYTQENLIDYLTHEVAPTRQAAAYALGIIGDTAAIAPLAKALQHSDPDMRSNGRAGVVGIWFRSEG